MNLCILQAFCILYNFCFFPPHNYTGQTCLNRPLLNESTLVFGYRWPNSRFYFRVESVLEIVYTTISPLSSHISFEILVTYSWFYCKWMQVSFISGLVCLPSTMSMHAARDRGGYMVEMSTCMMRPMQESLANQMYGLPYSVMTGEITLCTFFCIHAPRANYLLLEVVPSTSLIGDRKREICEVLT